MQLYFIAHLSQKSSKKVSYKKKAASLEAATYDNQTDIKKNSSA